MTIAETLLLKFLKHGYGVLIPAVCLFLSAEVAPSHALQQRADESITSSKKITPVSVAIRQDVQPYVTDEGAGGFEIDLVKAIFSETKYTPEFVQLPRVRMIQTFNSQGIDGLLTSNVTLKGQGCLTDWYIEHKNVGVTLAARKIAINRLPDIADMSIITFDGARSFLGPTFVAETKKSQRYIESPDQKIHVSLVYFGYFDVAIGDEWILKMAQIDHKRKSGTYKPLTIHRILPATLYGARFRDQAICDAFNKGLATIRANRRYDVIVSEHFDRITAHIADYEKELVSASEPGTTVH